MQAYTATGSLREAKSFFGPEYILTSTYHSEGLSLAKGFVTEDVEHVGRVAHVRSVCLFRQEDREYLEDQIITIGESFVEQLVEAMAAEKATR